MTRPVRNNTNRNPAQILKDAAPPRCTSAQKQADDAKAAAKKLKRKRGHQRFIKKECPKKKIQEQQDEDEETDGKYELSSTHSESASSELPSDDQSASSEPEACRKSHKAKSHKKKGKKMKERVLRQEVAANRKTIASAGTLARKRKNENVNSEIDANASKRVPQPKHVKATQLASNLNPDWQKTVGLLVKGSATRKSLDTDEVDMNLIPEMGLKINRKGVDDAVKEEVKAVKMLKPQKPLQKLKLKDLPLQDRSDRDVWNHLVCAVIDWAGSTTDPFGTNELPDLSPKLQELWDVFFHHNVLDINEHPTIKKIATDCLNEWRSTFGKDALKILECQFKHPEFRHDIDACIQFVHNYLPCKVNNQKCVPFIFADIENFKGAWLSPVLLELVATHVKHCGKYHCALSLYTEGESAKEAAKEAKRYGNSDKAGGKHAKNINFDAAWGSVAMRYAEQATGLPESRWEAIENTLSEWIGMDAGSNDEGFDNNNNDIMDIHGVVLLSNLDTEDTNPRLEQTDS
ncbi:hypothetical protein DFH29DRAFT_875722 [Suillus ampliporus]|nr:hypothetical protein DFH29DRAFT_875722 [Suillus ampliporus]